MSSTELIKLYDKDFAVSLKWNEYNGKKNIQKNKLKNDIKSKDCDGFGVSIVVSKDRSIYGFSDKKFKGVPSLAKFLSSKESFKNSLTLIKLEDGLFWLVGITKEGVIEQGTDIIYEKEDFIQNVEESLNFSASIDEEEEHPFKVLISNQDKDYIEPLIAELLSDFNVEYFDAEKELLENSKSSEIELIYNSSTDSIKQVGTLGLVLASLATGYYFIYLENPIYSEIIGSETSEGFYQEKKGYDKFLKEQAKRLTSSYEDVAKKEIIERVNTPYTNKDIYEQIRSLSLMFPLYLVEWELEDITYNDISNEFFRVSYKRINNSYGNIPEIKEHLTNILSKNNINKFQFQNPSVKGDRIFLNMYFKDKNEITFNIDPSEIKAINENIEKLNKEIKSISMKIENIESEVMDFSFLSKRFGSDLKEKESEIYDLISKSKKIYKELKEENKKLEPKDITINENILKGSQSELLSMTQKYSYYKWNTGLVINYPIPKNNRVKKGEVVNVFARSTDFEVGSNGNIDIIGINGLRNILLNESLLNKPYIKINSVSFNFGTEEWNIKGEYYEKNN